jgi:hypothetical protein
VTANTVTVAGLTRAGRCGDAGSVRGEATRPFGITPIFSAERRRSVVWFYGAEFVPTPLNQEDIVTATSNF